MAGPLAQPPRPDGRPLFFGVAFRLLGAFLVITTFAIIASAAALWLFNKYGTGFNRIASSSLPALIAASELSQKSQALATNAPNLALADGHFERRAVDEALRSQLTAIAEVGDELKTFAPNTEGLESVVRMETALKDNLENMDRHVAERIDADQTAATLLLRLRTLSNRIRNAVVEQISKTTDGGESRLQIEGLAAWMAAADEAIIVMLSTADADTTVRLGRLRSDFAGERGRIESTHASISKPILDALDPLEQTLIQDALRTPNIFDARAAQLASASAVRSALLENKRLSTQLVEEAERIFGNIQRDVKADSSLFSSIIANYTRIFITVAILCILVASAIVVYVNKSIIGRLKRLSEQMRAAAEGRERDVPDRRIRRDRGYGEGGAILRHLDRIAQRGHSPSSNPAHRRDRVDFGRIL